jgi:hypothetical protein
MNSNIRFRCPDCGKEARTVTEAEDIAAVCDKTLAVAEGVSEEECGMGKVRFVPSNAGRLRCYQIGFALFLPHPKVIAGRK